jgi:hypothetical protein
MAFQNHNLGSAALSLQEFDMKTLVYNDEGNFLNPRIAMIAKSGSGKSWVVRDIMYHIRDIPCGTVIAPTDKMTRFYNEFVPPSFTHHEYEESIIPRVLKRQKAMLAQNEDRLKIGKKKLDPRSFLIMDDCMSSKHLWLKDPNILSIFNEGRHYQLTFCLTMQYSLGIQPELRANFDFIFLLGEDQYSNRKRLYEHYAGSFPKFDIFDQVFNQVTANYGCMVINNRIRSTDITKKVFWYKAQKTPPFMVGIPKYIEWNRKHYDQDYDKKEPVLDLNTFCSKRRANITVKLV